MKKFIQFTQENDILENFNKILIIFDFFLYFCVKIMIKNSCCMTLFS